MGIALCVEFWITASRYQLDFHDCKPGVTIRAVFAMTAKSHGGGSNKFSEGNLDYSFPDRVSGPMSISRRERDAQRQTT